MQLIDTHQHLWDLDQYPYSWCAGISQLNRSFRFNDYVAASAGLGIVKTVLVECDVDEPNALAEAQTFQHLSDQYSSIAGIVAGVYPERPGFRKHLKQLSRLNRLRGVRRILHTQPDSLLEEPLFAKNLMLLPENGLSFDLCVLARQLPRAISLVRRCPGVSFILDHCGVPDVRAGALDPWREHIAEIASFPNVACKISGLVAYANPASWSPDDLRPWFEHVLARFGWSRVVWGGDWPVCTTAATLGQWVEATLELTRHASEVDRAKLFFGNAERLYRI